MISGLLIRDAERETEARMRQVVLQDAVHGAAALSRRLVERQQSLQVAAQTMRDPARWDASSDAHPGLAAMFDDLFVADPQGQVFPSPDDDPPLRAPSRCSPSRCRVQAVLGGVLRLGRTGLMGDVVEAGPDFGKGAISQLLAVTDGQGRRLVEGEAAPGVSPAAFAQWLSEAMRPNGEPKAAPSSPPGWAGSTATRSWWPRAFRGRIG